MINCSYQNRTNLGTLICSCCKSEWCTDHIDGHYESMKKKLYFKLKICNLIANYLYRNKFNPEKFTPNFNIISNFFLDQKLIADNF